MKALSPLSRVVHGAHDEQHGHRPQSHRQFDDGHNAAERCGEGDGQCDFVVVFHGAQDVQRGGFAGAGCAEETAWPFLQPVLFPGEPDIDSIADPAERKRRILLKQFYVSGIIGTFRAALSGSIMTTPTEIGHFVSEELLPRIAPHMQMPSQSETAQQPAASPQAQ